MAYDEFLADRIKNVFNEKRVSFEALKMIGGLSFMVNNKMCYGIVKTQLMARIGLDAYDVALTKEGCTEMDFTGRSMKGYVYLEPEAIDMEDDLAHWIQLAIDFNPMSKASPRKKKK
jgi:TfoX/Sxy family transcriptional regulator of competence genes